MGGSDVTGYLDGPTASDLDVNVFFDALFGLFERTVQNGHPNVQAADNQCAPAAVANSLQFLENTTPLTVPHDHKKGIKGDDSLVGQLDTDTDRGVVSRTDGSGVWPFDGKLKYISDNGLKKNLIVKHYGNGLTGGVPSIPLDSTEDVTRHGVTSVGKGAISWDAICDEIKDGEDVELDMQYFVDGIPDGRHYVAVIMRARAYVSHLSLLGPRLVVIPATMMQSTCGSRLS